MFPRAKVLVVGCGRMGQIRASILRTNPRFDICGIVDKDMSAASVLANKYLTSAYPSISQALKHHGEKSSSIQGIVISSPTHTHASMITEAAAHNIDIFTEKPVDETAQKVKHLFDICNEANVSLCCGFQRRFDDSYRATQQAISCGKIGKPLHANFFFADHPTPPKEFLLTGGDIFYDLSAHDVDYIRWCLNDEVVSVYATGTSSSKELEEAGVHDNATVVMNFKRGVVAHLFLSRLACYGYDQRCEIFGDMGLVSVGNEYENTSVISNEEGIHSARLKHSFPQRFHQAYASEMETFADVLLLGNPWPVTVHDCIAVQKVADAARESCRLNQVVEIHYDLLVSGHDPENIYEKSAQNQSYDSSPEFH